MCDFERFYRKIVLKKVTPAEIVNFNNNLKLIKEINEQLLKDKTLKKYLKNSNLSSSYSKINTYLEYTLNLEQASTISTTSFEDNIFNTSIYLDLDKEVEKFHEQNDQLQAVKKYLESFIGKFEKSKKNSNYVKEHKTDKSGMYFEITKRRSEILKREIKSVTSWPIEINYTSSYNKEKSVFKFDGNDLVFSSGTGNNKKNRNTIFEKIISRCCLSTVHCQKTIGKSLFKIRKFSPRL